MARKWTVIVDIVFTKSTMSCVFEFALDTCDVWEIRGWSGYYMGDIGRLLVCSKRHCSSVGRYWSSNGAQFPRLNVGEMGCSDESDWGACQFVKLIPDGHRNSFTWDVESVSAKLGLIAGKGYLAIRTINGMVTEGLTTKCVCKGAVIAGIWSREGLETGKPRWS